jgi:phenylalanyl-tRNA synthetase beta chain
MEYSLYPLNRYCNLNNLTIIDIIDKLNLIGFEVDEIIKEEFKSNLNIDNIRLLIKIPSNRDDLLNETYFLSELSMIFVCELYENWKNIKKNYFFLLKQNYFKYLNYQTNEIKSDLSDILLYQICINQIKNIQLPIWIEKKLVNNGLEVHKNLNDLLNLITFEWGQNFNISKILSEDVKSILKIERLEKELIYKISKTQSLNLEKGTIVVKNNKNECIFILGLINFLPLDENQEKIYLNAFFYDIEKNPLMLNTINTKLSLRFLRRAYLENFKFSFQRLLTLLEILFKVSIELNKSITNKTIFLLKTKSIIKLEKLKLKYVLNLNTYEKEIFKKANLKLICETPKNFYFQIPNSRKDLEREIDIIEEYSRFIGYKNFQEIIPKKKLIYTKLTQNSFTFIKQFFLTYGFHEIVTTPLNDINNKKIHSILINNPLTTDFSLLHSNLIFNVINTFENNLKIRSTPQNFFEISRVFKNSKKKIIEQDKLAGIFLFPFNKFNKQPCLEWFITKGFLETFLTNFGYRTISIEKLSETDTFYHPTKTIIIKYNNLILGKFGEINPLLNKISNIKVPIYLFEFDLHHFKNWRINNEIILYKEYSKYPTIIKDLSFLINKKENLSILKTIVSEGSPFLINLEFFDIYYDNLDNLTINIGLRLEFQSKTKTLQTSLIEKELEKIKEILIKNFNVEFR